ncbi:hypothetical protein TH53_08510 [Pedobacter lusitanus]|uniref:Uncharacterized protein n=1 Tax=Pedobacter lusitanus TaxID=1503925 RepID=A0A0D0FYP7_9SPHI|nr:hypothetical protein [Pedobacter lusitanus]KIO77669.1 hypothetical protein TH53_08510 [Pedobacter lusitanus]
MKKKQINSEKAKTYLILFGSITDPGGGGGDPGGGGGNPGGGTQNCIDEMEAALAGQAVNISVSSVTTDIDSANRYIIYTWTAYRGLFNSYQFNSVDVGYQQLVSGAWQFTSIAHQNVYLTGSTGGFTVAYTDILPPNGVVVGSHLATMTLNFKIRGTTYCFGLPIEGDID